MPDVSAYDDNILVSEYPLHAMIGVKDIRNEYQQRLQISDTPHLLLIKLHGMTLFDRQAQDFIAGDEIAAITMAVAILSDTHAGYFEHGHVLIDYFVKSNPLRFKVRQFDHENEAVEWLKSIK